MRLRRASRGSLVITRFTWSETPAVCPRWLRWLRWLRHGHVAGRSLPLASPGVKRQLSVRGGCGGCATGKSRGAHYHSLHPEKNASLVSAVVGWVYRVDGLGSSLAIGRTAGNSSPGKPSSPPQDFFRIFKNSQGFFTPFFQDIMVNSVLRFSPFRPACHLGNCAIFFFFFP